MKTCPACKIAKPLEAFNRQTKSKDGRYPYCRNCARAKVNALYHSRGKRSWMEDKTCSWCKVLKPRSAFRKDDAGKPVARCMACEIEIIEQTARGLRRCNICRGYLPLDAFHVSKLRFPNIACKECAREQANSYGDRRRNYELKKAFGITLDQYRELLARQGNTCPVCKVAFEPDNYSYHVDHAHGGKFRGRIRAVLHRDCNRNVMWGHEDSAQLRAAADLIDNPLTDWVVLEHMIDVTRKDRL